MMEFDVGARYTKYEENHSCCGFLGGLFGGALGGVSQGLFGFLGASQAASQQAAAQEQALALQQQIYSQTVNQLRPFYQGGARSWQELLGGLGTPTHPGVLTESPTQFGGLPSAPPAYNYVAPTLGTFQASPGYKFQLQQGVQAIQDAAGGRTGVLGGNTLQALQGYGTGLANQDWYNYLNNYNQLYAQKYAADTQNYWNRYGAAANTQQNLYNRFAAPASAGQQAANALGSQGQAFAGLLGNQYGQIGATQAAGTLGQYNALASAFNPTAGGGIYGSTISSLLNPAGGSGGYAGFFGGTPGLYGQGGAGGGTGYSGYFGGSPNFYGQGPY